MIEKEQTKRPIQLRILYGFLRIFFRLLYHPFARTYDLVAATVSLGKWKTWVYSPIPCLTGNRILELGHGPGHLQVELKRRFHDHAGARVIGLDFSRQMGRQARRRLLKSGLSPDLVNGDGRKLPFESRSFEHIVATFPTEYIVETSTLREVHRVLASGGTFIVLPAAWITGTGLPDRLAAWLFRITGQAPDIPDSAFKPYELIGFSIQTQFVEYPTSRLLLVIATKTT